MTISNLLTVYCTLRADERGGAVRLYNITVTCASETAARDDDDDDDVDDDNVKNFRSYFFFNNVFEFILLLLFFLYDFLTTATIASCMPRITCTHARFTPTDVLCILYNIIRSVREYVIMVYIYIYTRLLHVMPEQA